MDKIQSIFSKLNDNEKESLKNLISVFISSPAEPGETKTVSTCENTPAGNLSGRDENASDLDSDNIQVEQLLSDTPDGSSDDAGGLQRACRRKKGRYVISSDDEDLPRRKSKKAKRRTLKKNIAEFINSKKKNQFNLDSDSSAEDEPANRPRKQTRPDGVALKPAHRAVGMPAGGVPGVPKCTAAVDVRSSGDPENLKKAFHCSECVKAGKIKPNPPNAFFNCHHAICEDCAHALQRSRKAKCPKCPLAFRSYYIAYF